MLVSVISPGYLQSEWCNRESLASPRPPRTAAIFGSAISSGSSRCSAYRWHEAGCRPSSTTCWESQFYRVDAASGRARDLLLDPGADAMQVFRARVDDVAQDLSRLLGAMAVSGDAASAPPSASAADTVFLAWTTGDLSEEREKLRRELEARNYRVVPTGAPSLDATGVRASVLAALREAKVAIHLIGTLYGFVPEGEARSITELQSDEAIYQASNSTAARIFWFAPNAQPQDPRLSAFVDRLQKPSPQSGRVYLLVNQTIEDLKTLVLDRLNPASKAAPRPVKPASALVYLMCDQLDRANVAPIQDFLFDQALEVRLPLFEGDPEQIRAEHYETLKKCDGVLIFWGGGKEGWLRTMLRDLNKVFGLGRSEAYKAAALYLAELPDPSRRAFAPVKSPSSARIAPSSPTCCVPSFPRYRGHSDGHPHPNQPVPGLRPFMQEEADLFFGRDKQSDELVRRLAAGGSWPWWAPPVAGNPRSCRPGCCRRWRAASWPRPGRTGGSRSCGRRTIPSGFWRGPLSKRGCWRISTWLHLRRRAWSRRHCGAAAWAWSRPPASPGSNRMRIS